MFVCIDLHPSLQGRYNEVTNIMVNELGGTNIVWAVVTAAIVTPAKLPRTTFCIYPASLIPKDFATQLTEKLSSVFKEGGWVFLAIDTTGTWYHADKPYIEVTSNSSNNRLVSDIDFIRD